MANPRMTAEIGRVLGGRYRLIAPIGMGASAQVYLADDVTLRRRVALKMLHEALADDVAFSRRFRAEARAAAALSHPNVMAVYDWGEGDVAFIVTEYLSGGSLRALLDADGPLTPAQALGVGLEAARALDYAHRLGFVHHDIKPANLLFGEEQRLRIADFGLARALAEAAWTEPQGAVLGTARYASPEQAKGETLTGKSDVYSLALVLVEAVTGQVPFVADTTLGTLMARVDRYLPVSDALGPLQAILARAGHPDPTERIAARTLATGLLRAAQELSRPAPLALAGALSAASLLSVDEDLTLHALASADVAEPGVAPASAGDLTADDLELGPPDWVSRAPLDPDPAPDFDFDFDFDFDLADEDLGPRTEVISLDELDLTDAVVASPTWEDTGSGPVVAVADPVVIVDNETEPDARASEPDGDVDGDEARRRRRWPWAVLVVALLAGGGGVAAAATRGDDPPPPPSPAAVTLPVPALDGQNLDQIRAVLGAAGWKVQVVPTRLNDSKAGDVLGSEPGAGVRLRQGQTVKIVVSQGQPIVAVPAGLVGQSTDKAVLALGFAGLRGDVVDEVFSEDVPKGAITALAEGTAPKLEKGASVGLVASKGPRPRIVPTGLVGSTVPAATDVLAGVQLKTATLAAFSDTVTKGQIISVTPASGATLARGSTVTVVVSQGPELVAVPDVKGASSIAAAVARLKSAGLQAGSVSGPASGSPKGTKPGARTMVKKGATVDIVLG
ncbi:MAG: protein kinase domain-containing protein [Acidimicrobiales bacterium]